MVSIKYQLVAFLLRWTLNTLGIWVAVRLLGSSVYTPETMTTVGVFILAGFIFSLVNSTLKPIVTILSLPAILLTLGLFTLVVNGLMVWISLKITPGISMTFSNSILAGIILSLVNYIVSGLLGLRELKDA